MRLNGLYIVQRGNAYQIYLPSKICIAQMVMPPDDAYLADGKALEYITKSLAGRWGIVNPNGKDSK